MSADVIAHMVAEVIARVPPSLAAFGCRIAAGPGGPGARPLASLRDRAAFDAVVDGFGAAFGDADRRSVVSLWSQYYLPAIVIPALTAHVRLRCALPVAFGQVGVELDACGCPARFFLPDGGRAGTGREPCLTGLIDGHLRPFVELCHGHCGLSRRVLWGNAGVVVDHVLRELGGAPVSRGEEGSDARDGWPACGPWPRSPLAQTFRAGGPCDGRQRRVCCMRYRLPGVAPCGGLCPVDHATDRAC